MHTLPLYFTNKTSCSCKHHESNHWRPYNLQAVFIMLSHAAQINNSNKCIWLVLHKQKLECACTDVINKFHVYLDCQITSNRQTDHFALPPALAQLQMHNVQWFRNFQLCHFILFENWGLQFIAVLHKLAYP